MSCQTARPCMDQTHTPSFRAAQRETDTGRFVLIESGKKARAKGTFLALRCLKCVEDEVGPD